MTVYTMLFEKPRYRHEEISVPPEIVEATLRKFWRDNADQSGDYLVVLA